MENMDHQISSGRFDDQIIFNLFKSNVQNT